MNEQVLGFLGLMRRAGALAIGAEGVYDAARENKARMILVASDGAANTRSAMENAAAQREERIPLIVSGCTKRQLGAALGVRECVAAAVLDTGFALALCRKMELADLIPKMEERLEREKKRKAKKVAKKEERKAAFAGGAKARVAAKRVRTGRAGAGKPGAKGPAEGRTKSPRGHKPRVTGKRGN